MAIRVAHIGTGNVGRLALTGLITNPRLELTGVWVSSDAKVGKDAVSLPDWMIPPESPPRTTWRRCWPLSPTVPSTAPWPTTGWAQR